MATDPKELRERAAKVLQADYFSVRRSSNVAISVADLLSNDIDPNGDALSFVGIATTDNRGTLECALAEAAYLTGLERNADVVCMTSYAPLFGHVDAWQWRPNLIWVDNLRICGTPSYYVQQLFSRNRGDLVLPVQVCGMEVSASGVEKLYASAARDEGTGDIIIKVVNSSAAPIETELRLDGVKHVAGPAQVIVLASDRLTDENSLDAPHRVFPVRSEIRVKGSQFSHTFPAQSLTVLRASVDL